MGSRGEGTRFLKTSPYLEIFRGEMGYTSLSRQNI